MTLTINITKKIVTIHLLTPTAVFVNMKHTNMCLQAKGNHLQQLLQPHHLDTYHSIHQPSFVFIIQGLLYANSSVETFCIIFDCLNNRSISFATFVQYTVSVGNKHQQCQNSAVCILNKLHVIFRYDFKTLTYMNLFLDFCI